MNSVPKLQAFQQNFAHVRGQRKQQSRGNQQSGAWLRARSSVSVTDVVNDFLPHHRVSIHHTFLSFFSCYLTICFVKIAELNKRVCEAWDRGLVRSPHALQTPECGRALSQYDTQTLDLGIHRRWCRPGG